MDLDALDPVTRRLLTLYLEQAKGAVEGSSKRWCPHEPHQKQREFLDLNCLEALYGGAAGGGKSDALLMSALQYVDVPGYSAILFRRTFTDLKLSGAIMDRAHEWLAGTAAVWKDRDKRWEFPSGATLGFGYMDGPRDHHRYQSAEYQFIAFDELTQFEERQYTYMFSRIRRTSEIDVPLRMRAATNPGGIGHEWVGNRFNIPEKADIGRIYEHEGRVFVPARIDDNPSLDSDEYTRSLAELDSVTRQQLEHGDWIRDTSGLVYRSWLTPRNTTSVLPPLRQDERWSYVLAADFGVTDPTAFVVLAFAENEPVVYVLRSEQWTDLAPSDAASLAMEWSRDFGEFDRVVGDIGGLGKGFEAEWRKRYIPMVAASKSDKLGFIKLLNGDLEKGRVKVLMPGNELLIRHLSQLAWSDDKHRKEHEAMPNHLPDALLYGWREARHWAWEERDARPTDEAKLRELEEEERFQRRLERRIDDDSDWIWNDHDQ